MISTSMRRLKALLQRPVSCAGPVTSRAVAGRCGTFFGKSLPHRSLAFVISDSPQRNPPGLSGEGAGGGE